MLGRIAGQPPPEPRGRRDHDRRLLDDIARFGQRHLDHVADRLVGEPGLILAPGMPLQLDGELRLLGLAGHHDVGRVGEQTVFGQARFDRHHLLSAELQGPTERSSEVGLEHQLGCGSGPRGQPKVIHQRLGLPTGGQEGALKGLRLEHRDHSPSARRGEPSIPR